MGCVFPRLSHLPSGPYSQCEPLNSQVSLALEVREQPLVLGPLAELSRAICVLSSFILSVK